ncbi:hypothetical protein K1X13_04050 [Nocardioides sp. WL0053]|uniref:Phosphotransferase family enzyme n=1 Tax=Nocardioides jiangsuensis TaxID=2866161 RepID=A0ABS7RHI7_9ACTN|nr:hypothetical protein [Nocardioides jiangsuensis]MBY9073989.1 hypothetical protein [Nocardioides jiangsuensis]
MTNPPAHATPRDTAPTATSPPVPSTHQTSRRVKTEQLARMETICSTPYLERFVRPYLPAGTPDDGEWRTKTIQLDGSGAATVQICRDGAEPVFAKAFPFDDGPDVYAKLQVFRVTGFGAGQRYQTVEPLAWEEGQQVMLCRAAPGRAVSELIGGPVDALCDATAEAGRWLGSFHGSQIRVGAPQSLLVTGELTSLAKRLAKTTTQQPDYLPVALEMLAALDGLTYGTADGLLAQSHGQYRPIHVFTTPDTVTVIDLDRSAPADPARDVAEFLHHTRTSTYVATGDVHRADEPCSAFLAGYRETAGEEPLTNLRFHWARYVLHSLSKQVKSGDIPPHTVETHPTYLRYRAEFDRIVDGRAQA